MRFGSLFSGIGGFDLGLERAGMTSAWQVEIDEFCLQVLEKHWPEVPRYHDIRECGRDNLEPIDLLVGGFPCQPFSVAGKQRGADDDRNLWPETIRLVTDLRPRWCLFENVAGLIPLYLDTVLSDLEGASYAWEACIIPACAVDAPHRRDRVWIIAQDTQRVRRHGSQRGERAEVGRQREFGAGDIQRIHREPDVAHAEPGRRGKRTRQARQTGQRWAEPVGSGPNIPNAPSQQAGGVLKREFQTHPGPSSNGRGEASRWTTEPNVGRVAHGIPRRVDRLRSLGNAVVPQVVEHIGNMILEADNDN